MSLITSTISHEMRNPLNSIISQCKIMAQNNRELKQLLEKQQERLPLEDKQHFASLVERIE